MTKIFKHISAAWLAFSLLLPAACTDEDLRSAGGQPGGVDRNHTVDITLPYGVTAGMDRITVTKGSNEEKMDSQLGSVLVLVYEALDANNPALNRFVYSRFFPSPGSGGEGWVPSTTDRTRGTMTLTCPTGHVYIYLVANWTNTFIDFAEGITAGDLDAGHMPQTQAELFSSFIPSWKGNIHTVDGLIPMIAHVNNSTGLCKVEPDGNISYVDDAGNPQTIATDGTDTSVARNFNFRRLMAKITMHFSIAPNGDAEKPNTNATFTPSRYIFRNVADHVAPTPDAWAGSTSALNGTSDTDFENFNTQSPNSFTVYIPENLEACDKEINAFSERERMVKDAYGHNLTYTEGPLAGKFRFANAPEYATYVEVIGKYKDPDNDIIDADTRFFIHLGHFSKDNRNFDVVRDHHYTYDVKVRGVDDIIVESMDNQEEATEAHQERNPGVEGLVFRGGLRAYCDAHYDQVEMRLSKNEIQDSTVIFAFTPYGTKSGIYYPKGSRINKSDTDRRQTGEFKPLSSGTTLENMKQYLGWIEIKRQNRRGELARYSGERMDIFAVLDEVCTQSYPLNRHYTVFVDEYYYTRTPEGNQAHIRDFVNKGDRSFALGKSMFTSKDGNSVTIDAIYLVYQKSIATFYDLDDTQTRKFGVETVCETGRQTVYGNPSQNGTDYWNGLRNTRQEAGNLFGKVNWDKNGWLIEEVDGKEMLVDQGAERMNRPEGYFTCLSRNRDFNGNGEIEEEEIRWYNPAVNQVISIWIGETGLPRTAALFTEDFATTELQFSNMYTPAGVFTSTDAFRVVWAEEGCSIGNADAASQHGGETRTIRNLAADITGDTDWMTTDVEDYKYYRYDSGTRVVEVFLSPITLRDFSPGELAPHTERTAVNRLYNKIQLAAGPYKEIGVLQSKTDPVTEAADYSGSEPEPGEVGGWRLPNQRELALLFLVDPNWPINMSSSGSQYIHCRTSMTINTQLYKPPYYIGHNDKGNAYTPFGYVYQWDINRIQCMNFEDVSENDLPDPDFSLPKYNRPGWIYCVRDVRP